MRHRCLDVRASGFVEIVMSHLHVRRVVREDDALARDLFIRIAEPDVDAVLPREGELRQRRLARAGVLGLLDHDDLVLVHRLGQGERRSKRSVARRSSFHSFHLGEQFCYIEYFALLDGQIIFHISQRPGRASRCVCVVRVGRVRNAESGVSCRKRLSVEVLVGRHAQSRQIYRRSDHLRVRRACYPEASCSSGQVAAAGVRYHDDLGVLSFSRHDFFSDLCSERLYARDAEVRIERRIEVSRLLKDPEVYVEQLRPYRQLDYLGPESLALSLLFYDLGLADAFRVKALLDDDRPEVPHRTLGSDRCAVVSAGRGHDAFVSHLLRHVYGYRCSSVFERSRRIRALVLDEYPGAFAFRRDLPGKGRQIFEFKKRSVADADASLDLTYLFERHIDVFHHLLIIKGDVSRLIFRIVYTESRLHYFTGSVHDSLITHIFHHLSPPSPRMMARA